LSALAAFLHSYFCLWCFHSANLSL